MKRIFCSPVILFIMVLALTPTGNEVYGQGLSFFKPIRGKEKRTGNVPTVITAETMDIDAAKNIAVFAEKVVVDDEEMHITCHRMTIFLEDKTPVSEAKSSAETSNVSDVNPEESKQVSRIICEQDVIIIRKTPEQEDGKKQEEQKALAGHADYDVKTGKIVLTKNPVLMRGEDTMKGEIITIWRDSEKVNVEGGGEIRITPEDKGSESEAENQNTTNAAKQNNSVKQ